MALVSLDSSSCEVPCLILHLVVYRDVTRQAKGLYRLNHVRARRSGLAYLSRGNSGWFYHNSEGSLSAGDGSHSMDQPAGKVQGQEELATESSNDIPENHITR
jgi:hypothetical protein